MSLNLPPLNGRHIASQVPDMANQENSKNEQGDRVDSKDDDQED